jgi:hypothetical protein
VILGDEHSHRRQGWPTTGDSEVTAAVTVLSPPADYNCPDPTEEAVSMHTAPSSQMRARPAATAAVTALVAALAVVLAGCGSNAPPRTTTSAAATQNPAAAAYRYADCMRGHGVTNFPDPQVINKPGQQGIRQAVPAGVAGTPKFNSAQKACHGLMPALSAPSPAQQHAHLEVLLAFARCLRSHGITKFPDPDSQGNLPLPTIQADGVDIHAPGFLTAARDCVGVTHGTITMPEIRQAVNHG